MASVLFQRMQPKTTAIFDSIERGYFSGIQRGHGTIRRFMALEATASRGRLRLARWCRRSSRKINATLDLRWLRDELAPYQSSIGRPSIDREPMIRMLVVGSPDFAIHIGTIFFRTKREHQSAASCARDQISPQAPARGRLLVQLALGRSCMRQLLVWYLLTDLAVESDG
jgi:hypothetical protein